MSTGPDTSQPEGDLFGFRGQSLIIWASLFMVLCTLSVILRFVSLRVGRRPIGLEDWLILPAWMLEMGLCLSGICSVLYGGAGRHEAYVIKYEPQAVNSWGKTVFATELLYGLVFPIEKTAILLLYLRLFRIRRWFRITTYVLIAYIWLWGVSEVLVAFVQCTPFAYQWDKTLDGHCIDQLAYYRWVSVPNIIHDVVMLILPLPMVWSLQIELRQKLALSGVFLIGSIGCIASFVRLAIFFKLDALDDNTWTSIELQSWTLAETGVVLISSCLPDLWPLFLHTMTRNGTRCGGFSKRMSTREGLRSNQSKSRETRRSSLPGFSTTSEFIPLDDIEGRSINEKDGIIVKTEISWSVSHGAESFDLNEGRSY